MSLLTTLFSTKDLDCSKGAFDTAKCEMIDFRTEKFITSGDFFEIKTDNPIARPLLSFQLLEMQWFLQRVIGMAGAASPYEPDWLNEDSDEEIPNLELDEV
jgi:hypothetical protein